MLKKTMTYVDFDGEERTETFQFNLTKAELLESELGVSGGQTALLEKIVATKEIPALVEIFKGLIIKSYGEKSPDGKRFSKKPEIIEAFTESNAYSDLFVELSTNTQAAIDFVTGIMPKDMVEDPDVKAKLEELRK